MWKWKIISSYKTEYKLLIRNYGCLLFLLLAVFYSSYHYYCNFVYHDPGGVIISTAFIIQGGLFASMILGFSLIQKETKCWANEVFYVLPDGYFHKMFAKYLVLITSIFAFTFISTITLLIFFYINNVHHVLYWKSIQYMILYWLIPFYIAGIIGMIAGSLIHSRMVYLLLIIIWLLIGPLNSAIFKPLMAMLGTDLNQIGNFFNLGQTDPNTIYDPVYGLPLEIHRWVQKGLWLTNITLLFIMLIFKNNHSNHRIRKYYQVFIIFLLALNIPLINSVTKEEQVISTRYEKNSVKKYDAAYYSVNKYPAFQNDNSFLIEAYDINLVSHRDIKTTVNTNIRILKETKSITFTLYHDLRIQKVTDNSNTEITFVQKGDQVAVTYPENLKKGELRELSFIYEGTSSPYFYANEQAVMLPAYFPWLPVAGSYQAMKYENNCLTRNFMESQNSVKYTLTYSGPEPLYTNLKKEGEDKWNGETSCGISLAAGMLTETNFDSINVVYPVTLDCFIKKLPEFFISVKGITDNIKKDLELKDKFNPQKVFVLSVPSESNQSNILIWNLEDYLIIGIDQMYNDNVLQYVDPVSDILSALIRGHNNQESQNMLTKNLFIASYTYWYNIEYQTSFAKERTILSLLIDNYKKTHEKEASLAQKIKNYIDKNQSDPKLINSFF